MTVYDNNPKINIILFMSKFYINIVYLVLNQLAKDGLCEKTDYFRVRELAHSQVQHRTAIFW